jgi:hypothetical protein
MYIRNLTAYSAILEQQPMYSLRPIKVVLVLSNLDLARDYLVCGYIQVLIDTRQVSLAEGSTT